MFLAGFPPPQQTQRMKEQNRTTLKPCGVTTKQSSMTKAPTKAGERGQQKKGHI